MDLCHRDRVPMVEAHETFSRNFGFHVCANAWLRPRGALNGACRDILKKFNFISRESLSELNLNAHHFCERALMHQSQEILKVFNFEQNIKAVYCERPWCDLWGIQTYQETLCRRGGPVHFECTEFEQNAPIACVSSSVHSIPRKSLQKRKRASQASFACAPVLFSVWGSKCTHLLLQVENSCWKVTIYLSFPIFYLCALWIDCDFEIVICAAEFKKQFESLCKPQNSPKKCA